MKDVLQSTIEEEDGQVQLWIPSVRQEDQGAFQCVASNEEEGDDAAQALVQIRLPSEPSLLT